MVVLGRDFQKLFGWALIPSSSNAGGAVGRIHASDVLYATKKSLSGDLSLSDWTPEYASPGFGVGSWKIWIRNMVMKWLLLAEGNFIREPARLVLPMPRQYLEISS